MEHGTVELGDVGRVEPASDCNAVPHRPQSLRQHADDKLSARTRQTQSCKTATMSGVIEAIHVYDERK